jgi:hypothetical protein
MTQLLRGASGLLTNILTQDDQRVVWPIWRMPIAAAQFTPERPNQPYNTGWWPGTNGFIGEQAVDFGVLLGFWYEQPVIRAGVNSRYGVEGVTRDVYGTPIGGCTVKLYRTLTDELVSATISEASTGAFLASTPYYPETHYLVSYKAGSPDLSGTSVNTLIGA